MKWRTPKIQAPAFYYTKTTANAKKPAQADQSKKKKASKLRLFKKSLCSYDQLRSCKQPARDLNVSQSHHGTHTRNPHEIPMHLLKGS